MKPVWIVDDDKSIRWVLEKTLIKQSGAINRGDIIAFCLNGDEQHLGLTQHYLHIGLICNGSDPLIKQVIAIPGDDIVLTENTITVNQKQYFYKTHHYDSFNRPLITYPRGLFKNTEGYWLIGNHNANSWDSRYWGPISDKQILDKIKTAVNLVKSIDSTEYQ